MAGGKRGTIKSDTGYTQATTDDQPDGEMVDLEAFQAVPKRGCPQVHAHPVNGFRVTRLPLDGHWEGDKWVTSQHVYSKVDGKWYDETGKWEADAWPNDVRPPRQKPPKEELRQAHAYLSQHRSQDWR